MSGNLKETRTTLTVTKRVITAAAVALAILTTAPLITTVTFAQTPLTIDVSIDSKGSVNPKTGVATITGTLTCSSPTSVDLGVVVEQRALRAHQILTGVTNDSVECDGQIRWTLEVLAERGFFHGGPASVDIEAEPPDLSAFDQDAKTVQLIPALSA